MLSSGPMLTGCFGGRFRIYLTIETFQGSQGTQRRIGQGDLHLPTLGTALISSVFMLSSLLSEGLYHVPWVCHNPIMHSTRTYNVT